MSFDKRQLRSIIRIVLEDLDMHSAGAEELILGTIAQESKFGTYIAQLGNGPALGICQMEPNTEEDIWQNYLISHSDIRNKLKIISGVVSPSRWQLRVNLAYQIAMCRMKYRMCPGHIPDDMEGQAAYWKKYYNTYLGKGTTEEYIANYHKYVA